MEMQAIRRSYARWAPVYDLTFGAVTHAGRNEVAAMVNARGGALLEVGVGTGMSLESYAPGVAVTGVDISREMLAKAAERVVGKTLKNVVGLHEMDARALDFPDDSFDHVAAIHIMAVVPDPEIVMAEMARVCKPGGHVYVASHFKRDRGFLAMLERAAAPMANLLGWHSDFERARVTGCAALRLDSDTRLPPFGMMNMLRFSKAG
jgi:phosphatidylethanolamine/phosphatidyl-N-methylethanolamine N-methyltransferase